MKNILIFVYLLTISSVFSAGIDIHGAGNELIKRNVLVLPFVNSNNDQNYDFLKDTIIDAIKANLNNTDQFNLSNPLEIGKTIDDMGFNDEKMLVIENTIRIAKSLKSDVVVAGKFIAIDDKIMIQIQAIDVFTGEIVVIINQSGGLGINLLKLIDDVSKNLSGKMSEKFPKVDKSYFFEMTKIMNEKNVNKFNLPVLKVVGIGLCVSGSALLTIGLPIFICDFAWYSDALQAYKNKTLSEQTINSYYYIFIGLFALSTSLSSIGIVMTIISIPLMVYKKKEKRISLAIEFNPDLMLLISYKF